MGDGRTNAHPAPVALLRRFNRFHTRLTGTLDRSYLETPFSLQEARVVFEVATHPGCTAKDVRLRAGFDQGYLSRLVARLAKAGVLRKAPSGKDGREQRLFLTASGRRAFQVLDRRANQQAERVLAPLGPAQVDELCQALQTVQGLLDRDALPEPIRIRTHRVGDLGWAFHRQAVVYEREFGYRPVFEAYVCRGLPAFLDEYDAGQDRLWIAETGGRPAGFIAVHHSADRPGWAKLRWFLVEREARGRGLGGRLLEKAVEFCRRSGYQGIYLWTVSDLHAARALYERAGFTLAQEKADCEWAPWAREQRWELALGKAARRRPSKPEPHTP
jgi:DNA-binding MarR family transcriptional regulator/GNAT superfamily N-acetyltransferase